ncbi:uncharacterized protein LOC115719717 isoform X1 [Cannabis sativa]|uniref:uncharacterized protein LOC115719717 isoform X1 n=1 Tax=Cannabis sativa TaxID=3483 RepID=UPI0029CAA68D|nr:uncharacterized protein LOC115719717 isoform X1 [Cannabis sativa]XP_060965872.1 uncharacterized protein LOC115719717 isoform X1 [Cannabis sativa]XP_060965873.1 uncharacterized protein LOC115719717 isoform X1 [Cannabis sativa]
MEKEADYQIAEFDRFEIWKKCHMNTKGEVEGPAAKIAKQIDKLRKQVEEGVVQVEGKRDVLTMALGTDEHGGWVRAMGFGVTQTKYFNTRRPKRKNTDGSNQASSDLERRVRETEESNRKLQDKVDELIRLISSQHSSVASGSGVGGALNEQPHVDLAFDPVAQPLGAANVYSAPDPIAQPSGAANVYSPSPPHFREEIAPAAALPPSGGSSEETLPCWMHCLLEPSGMVLKVASGHILKEKYLSFSLTWMNTYTKIIVGYISKKPIWRMHCSRVP